MKAPLKHALENAGYKVIGNFVEIENTLYPLPAVKGNKKLGETVYHNSTLATNQIISATNPKTGETVSCKGTCPTTCDKGYCTKGNYRFNNVKFYNIMRTEFLRKYPHDYFNVLSIQLTVEKVEKDRIHATGDFEKVESELYYDLVLNHPAIKFWTYTKCAMSEDLQKLDSLPNMNIVKSIIPGYGFNFGKIAYIAALFYYLKRLGKSVYICRCGIDKNQHCSNCDGCSSHEYVLFVEHGTGYNPENDYNYNKFVELVENQKNVKVG